jgi:hypothetical protein
MKAHILLIILFVWATTLSAQVSINIDGSAPDGSAMLDVKSTTSGLLAPRLTAAQRDAIASPANGLTIFCTDNNQFYVNKGTPAAKNWALVSSQWLLSGSDIYYSAGNVGIGISTPHAPLQFANSAVNRKIVLFDNNNNDHQYYGFGINGSTLRYQVDYITASHVFYAGTSSTNSAELLRIRGDGKVGIGINDLTYKLEIANDNLGNTAGNTVLWQRIRGQSANTDQLQIYHRRFTVGTDWQTAEIRIQKAVDVTAMHYISFKGGNTTSVGSLVFGYQDTEQMVFENDGNIGIGTSNPAESAALDISSTSRGFLPPRMNTSEIALIQNPANGLVVYNTSDNHLFVYTASGNVWKRVSNDATIITPSTCGSSSITVNHFAGAVAPVSKTVTYGLVSGIPGEPVKCWITSNLGADHQATVLNDNTEASAGWYWQFNHKQGYKHDGTTRTPNTTWLSNIENFFDWQSVNDPCTIELGTDWRIPTYSEWFNVYNIGSWTNWNGPWNSALKMHAAGELDYFDGHLVARGVTGSYWTSSNLDQWDAYYIYFGPGGFWISTALMSDGYPLRCLKE